MGMRSRKAEIKHLLLERDRDALVAWTDEVRNPERLLISLTYDADELLRFRAIEASGWLAAQQAAAQLERIRDSLRRLLWLMNDESGGLGWHAPELIGEILVNVPSLIDEFAHMLPAFFREEPFERGAHMAVYRIAGVTADPFGEIAPLLRRSLAERDPAVRAYAALSLLRLGGGNGVQLDSLREDFQAFSLYNFDTGELQEISVGAAIARELGRLQAVRDRT